MGDEDIEMQENEDETILISKGNEEEETKNQQSNEIINY